MLYVLILAMLVGWYEGGQCLYRTRHGLEVGVKPSANLIGFLFLDKRTQ